MVDYTLRSELLEWGKERRATAATESYHSQSLSGATFLSHSSKDGELVAGATKILENHGARVYIDEIDPAMPPTTSKVTADTLKSRIKQTKRFVLLASENSKDSRWVPWELGCADGFKSTKKIAIFPAVESRYATSWTSQEYLGLYDRIVWGGIKGYEKDLWMVLDEDANTAVPLCDWLLGD